MPVRAIAGSVEKSNGFYLEMKNPIMGRMTLYLSKDGGKLISAMVSMLVTSPSGKIYAFNPDSKIYAEYQDTGQLQKRIDEYGVLGVKDKFKYKPWKKLRTEQINGLPVNVYGRYLINPPADPAHHLTSTYQDIIWIAELADRKLMEKFFKPVSVMIARDKPPETGVIVRRRTVWNKYKNGKLIASDPRDDLELLVCKKIQVDKKEFCIPSSYTKTNNETDILPDELSFRFR
jgi:hypothetical protein